MCAAVCVTDSGVAESTGGVGLSSTMIEVGLRVSVGDTTVLEESLASEEKGGFVMLSSRGAE